MAPILLALAAAASPAPDIVVTAQLREEKAIDVPIAVTVIGGAQLDRLGFTEFEDAARLAPGLAVQNQSPNDPGFVIRGITSDSGAAFEEPRVSIFQDGISIARSRASYVELFDVDRIEVAKGPQTTLYGRGALIGAINIVQNKADPAGFAASLGASYGSRDARIGEAMVNLPAGDGLALRIAGRLRQRDGTVRNLLGGAAFNSDDSKAARASLHADRGALSVDLIGNWQQDDPSGTSFKSIAYRPTDPVTGAVTGDRGRTSGAALGAAAGFEEGGQLGLGRSLWSLSAIATLTLSDGLDLVSLSGYRRFDAREIFDLDGVSLPIVTAAEDARGRQISQELRLRYEKGLLAGFLGASWFRESGSQRTPAQFDERMVLAQIGGALSGLISGRPITDPAPAARFGDTLFTGALVGGLGRAAGVTLSPAQAQAIAANLRPDHRETSTNMARTSAFDLFADASLALSDRIEIGAGLRWSHDDKRTRYAAAILGGRSVLGGLIGALSLPSPQRDALLAALAVPGAAAIPPSSAYPVPLFGLGLQPTGANGTVDSAHLTDGNWSWRFTARYEPNAMLSLYVSYARGVRPRLLAASAPALPGATTRFDRLPSERVDSIEAGFKSLFAHGRLSIDGALYHYRYANFQTMILQGTQFLTVNAGRARSTGFEGQMRWQVVQAASAFAGYAWNHTRFTDGLRDGNRFRLSPDHAASAGLIVDLPAGPGRISIVPSLSWQSSIFFDDDNDRPDLQQIGTGALVADNLQDERQGGYALVNARIGYRFADGLLVEGFVTNLFDRRTIKDAGNSGDDLGLPTFVAGEPRFYGVRLAMRFGAKD